MTTSSESTNSELITLPPVDTSEANLPSIPAHFTAPALEAIRLIARDVPDAIVGVGTLTRPQDFKDAMDAGAKFGVSPGLTQAMIEAAHETKLPLLPGVFTPSDVITARLAGFSQLKLFPAQQAGGIGMLKALGHG